MAVQLQTLARAVVPQALRAPLRRAAYYGHRRRCPVCDSRVRRYLAEGVDRPILRELDVVGAEHRVGARCPVCWAGSRTRLVWLYLQRVSGLLDRPSRVLHVAPEPGLCQRLHGAPLVDYHAGDRAPGRYAHAPGLVQLDLLALPYPEATFDAILANHVLEHVEDDRAAMSEILRVLRPGGLALLQVPIALGLKITREDPTARTPEARERVHGQRDHVRLYANDYPDRLRAVGFEVHAWRPETSAVEAFDLNPRECLFVARRPRPQALARRAA